MDPTPVRIVVQQAWRPEVIIEESEEELEAFNNDRMPAPSSPVYMKSRIDVVRLQVPPMPTYGRKKKKKRAPNSVRKVGKTLQFVTRWAQKRHRIAKQTDERDVFMKKFRSSVPATPIIVRPSFSPHMAETNNGSWIKKYLPLNPTSRIIYW